MRTPNLEDLPELEALPPNFTVRRALPDEIDAFNLSDPCV